MKPLVPWALGSLASLLLASLGSCGPGGDPSFPTATCPSAAAASNAGPAAPARGRSTVDIELTRAYLKARVEDLLEPNPKNDAGASVSAVELRQDGAKSILELRLRLWMRDDGGPSHPLDRYYRLSFELTPRLITPATVPDAAERAKILCPDSATACKMDEGALLSFDLIELYNVSASRPACYEPDFVDGKVAPIVYKQLEAARPLPLPTDAVGNVLSTAAGEAVHLADVTIGSDGALRVGLEYQGAATHAFDRSTMLLSRFPEHDWLVDIDKGVLPGLVRKKIEKLLDEKRKGATVDSLSLTLTPGVLRATVSATMPVGAFCGNSAKVDFDVPSPVQVCRNAQAKTIIANQNVYTASSGNVCFEIFQFFENLKGKKAAAWSKLSQVFFKVGKNDWFYATSLDTNDAFAIAGRSTAMDDASAAAGKPRPLAPALCPLIE